MIKFGSLMGSITLKHQWRGGENKTFFYNGISIIDKVYSKTPPNINHTPQQLTGTPHRLDVAAIDAADEACNKMRQLYGSMKHTSLSPSSLGGASSVVQI